MIISFDLDSVLAAFQLGWIKFNKQKYNEVYKFEDFTDFDYRKVMKLNGEVVFKRIFEFYDSEIFPELQPIEYAVEVVEELAKSNTLYILTSRSHDVEVLTMNWVNRYFPTKFKEVLFTGQISRDGFNHSVTKQELCKTYSIDVHIEDAPLHVTPVAEMGTRVIVLDKPWNREITFNSPLITRIKSLKELPEILLK